MKPVPSERSPLSHVPERLPPRLSAHQQGPGNSPQTPEQPGKLQKTGVGRETELAFCQGQLAVLKCVVGHRDAQGPAGEEGPGQPPSGQQGACPGREWPKSSVIRGGPESRPLSHALQAQLWRRRPTRQRGLPAQMSCFLLRDPWARRPGVACPPNVCVFNKRLPCARPKLSAP